MSATRAIGKATLCFAQSALLLFGNVGIALAASNFTSAEMTRIESSERSIFGSPHANLSTESRLRALETNLFGDVKKGSVDSRLDAIEKTLKIDHSKFLMPPEAAQLDRPPVEEAPAVVSQDYGEEPKSPAGDLIQEAMKQYSAGDLTTAERTFKRALSIDKNNPDAYFNLGVLYEGKGDLQLALENYSKAQALNPGDKELRETVQSLRGKIAQDRSNQIAAANKAEQDKQSAQQRENLRQMVANASSDYKSGNFTEAARKLEKVASSAPSDPDVQYALGQAYKAKGDTQHARIAFNKALSIDPSSSLYKKALGDLSNTIASAPPAAPAPAYRDSQVDDTPAGEITPFQSTGGSSSESFGSSGGGRFYGGGISSGYRSARLKRAVAGGAVGAAAGALWAATTHGGLKGGAMRGALLGGMLGYFSGQ